MSTLERFGDGTVTTLASAIDAVTTSITVTDASNYPAVPFRMTILDTDGTLEITRVTAKAGPVFTVTRGLEGTTATAHDTGVEVANTLTKAGLLNIMDCMSINGTRAARPASDADLEGRLYFTTSPGWYLFQDDGSSWDVGWGPIFELTEPDESGLSWINQGTASTSTTDGGVYLTTPAPGGAGENVRLRVQDVSFVDPTSDYTVTAAFTPLLFPSDQTSAGLIFRESGTGEFIFFRVMFDTTSGISKGDLLLSVDKYDNATTFNSNYKVLSASYIKSPTIWLKMEDDTTDLIWSFSNDGKNFHTFDTQTRTDFMAGGPDQIGYAVNSNNTTGSAAMTLFSWTKI